MRGESVTSEDADNVYLREYLAQRSWRPQPGGYEAWLRAPTGPTAFERRVACVRRYAFGVPSPGCSRGDRSVRADRGAGRWHRLLGVPVAEPRSRHRRVRRGASGQAPNAYKFEPRTWTQVVLGGVEVLDQHADRALFLCWPGYQDTFADEALARFTGHVLIYVGEQAGGHTANDAFFDRLGRDWARGAGCHPAMVGRPRLPGHLPQTAPL